MLHLGTLIALLAFFRADWFRLVPAWFASIRDRSIGGDPDRRLAWLLALSTIPAVIVGLAPQRPHRDGLPGGPAGGGDARRRGGDPLARRARRDAGPGEIAELSTRGALGIGVAQALALVPGISRSGISISAGLFAGLDREAAARFSFLMATPITAGAGAYETRKLLTGEAGVDVQVAPLVAGMIAALVAGLAAIAILLRFLRTHPTTIFIAYRLVLAAVVVVAWLGLWDRQG